MLLLSSGLSQPVFKHSLCFFRSLALKNNYTATFISENSIGPSPIISLPSSAFRTKKTRIPNVVETKITDYPKLKTTVLRNRARKSAGLPKITMLQRDKYVGPRTIFMDRLIATQDRSIELLHKTVYKEINLKSDLLSGIPPELTKDVPTAVKNILSLSMATKNDIFNARKQKIINQLQAHPNDTGSPEVIVGVMTNKAVQLAEHLKNNRHDFHAQKLLIQTIQRSWRMLSYLKRRSLIRYFDVQKKLGIVHTDLV